MECASMESRIQGRIGVPLGTARNSTKHGTVRDYHTIQTESAIHTRTL